MRGFITAALLGLGCDAVTMVDGACPEPSPETVIDGACPEPSPETVIDAGTPSLIEVNGARAMYAWSHHGGPLAPWTFAAFTAPSWEAAASGGAVDVPDLLAGDSIFVLGHLLAETAGGEAGLRVVVAENEQLPIAIQNAVILLKPTSPRWSIVNLIGIWNVSVPGQARVMLEGRADPGGRLYVHGSAEIIAIQLRP